MSDEWEKEAAFWRESYERANERICQLLEDKLSLSERRKGWEMCREVAAVRASMVSYEAAQLIDDLPFPDEPESSGPA